MSGERLTMAQALAASGKYRDFDPASPPAFADGPVADTAETVTAQAGVVGAEPDRDDTHSMGHEA